MPSADFCTVIPAPRGAGSPDGQPCRSPRVLRTHFHAYACRIYVMAFCASIGFRRFRTAYPAMPPRIRFLFVRPAICLGLPSDSQSPAKPLPLASTSPCRVCGGLPPLSERALPGAPKKKPGKCRAVGLPAHACGASSSSRCCRSLATIDSTPRKIAAESAFPAICCEFALPLSCSWVQHS